MASKFFKEYFENHAINDCVIKNKLNDPTDSIDVHETIKNTITWQLYKIYHYFFMDNYDIYACEFKNKVNILMPEFKYGEHDSSVFFNSLLDLIDSEITNKPIKSNLCDLIEIITTEKYTCPNCHYVKSHTFNYKLLNLFTHSLTKKFTTLNECLQDRFDQVPILRNFNCVSCGHLGCYYSKEIPIKLSKIFMLSLMRDDTNLHPILSPIELDLKAIIPSIDIDKTKYKLVGMIKYKKTMYGGHYISVCKFKDTWYQFDDFHSPNVKVITNVNDDDMYHTMVLMYEQST
jgi:ubiquitin C-terminal hydrolase